MDIFRFTEIAEAGQVILNPFTADQLKVLGQLCGLRADQSILDLGCGIGELLCTRSRDHDTRGVGVDIFEPLRARRGSPTPGELGVADRVRFVTAPAVDFDAGSERFDVVACIGSAWVGGSLADTLGLMRRRANEDDPLLLVGEPFRYTGTPYEELRTLADLADVFADAGFEVVEMVMASQEGWDRYSARKWWTADQMAATLAEFLWLAEQVTGVEASVLAKGSRIDLADSALHAPSASFGGRGVLPRHLRQDRSAGVPARIGTTR